MNLTKQRIKLLSKIGKHPEKNKQQLADSLGWGKQKTSSTISLLRKYTMIVKAPPYDHPNQWMLTGKGRRELVSELRELGAEAKKSDYNVFRPRHARKN